MAMSYVIRKASPPVVPLALRAISSPRINLTGSFPNPSSSDYYKLVPNYSELKEASFLSNQFSSAASVDNNNKHDKKFVKVLRSQIKLAKHLDSQKRVLSKPIDFPFTIIEDKPGESCITLERMLHGEKIQVWVYMPGVIMEAEEENLDSDDSSSDYDSDDVSDKDSLSDKEDKSVTTPAPTIQISLGIRKEKRDTLQIDTLASSDEVIIQNMTITNRSLESSTTYIRGPKFETLTSEMQYCLKKFLKNIGIDGNNVKFLYQYMVRKSKREEMIWMEELEKFVKK